MTQETARGTWIINIENWNLYACPVPRQEASINPKFVSIESPPDAGKLQQLYCFGNGEQRPKNQQAYRKPFCFYAEGNKNGECGHQQNYSWVVYKPTNVSWLWDLLQSYFIVFEQADILYDTEIRNGGKIELKLIPTRNFLMWKIQKTYNTWNLGFRYCQLKSFKEISKRNYSYKPIISIYLLIFACCSLLQFKL